VSPGKNGILLATEDNLGKIIEERDEKSKRWSSGLIIVSVGALYFGRCYLIVLMAA
jgi:hypothetical protein